MKTILDDLSNREHQLYEIAISVKGLMEEKEQQLKDSGTFTKYRLIHKLYLELFESTEDDNIKLEALKRLTFLNWYSYSEPSCFTGINTLDEHTIFTSFHILNEFIKNNKLDKEFTWMLSFYSSCWAYIFLMYSENKFPNLTGFVERVNTSTLHIPKHQLTRGTMDNRGQMGIYWKSLSVEKQEAK